MVGSQKMLRLACVNLAVVAFLGFLMRLKIVVSIAWINQKFLLNGHSHFAYIGWVGFVGILFCFYLVYKGKEIPKKVQLFIKLYFSNSWFMLIAFLLTGYSPFSMLLLCVHIGLSIWFAFWWRKTRSDVGHLLARKCLDWANVFNLISFVGPLLLGAMIAFRTGDVYAKQNSIYFFLHYQYNGYFLFTCLALLASFVGPALDTRKARMGVYLYGLVVMAGIGLLMLIREKPMWLIATNYTVAVALFVAMALLIPEMVKGVSAVRLQVNGLTKVLWALSFAGLLLKMVLQMLSAIPSVAYMVYEHRSIAIGYLHLVFLIIITFFYLGFIREHVNINRRMFSIGVVIFAIAAIFNEILLGAQGLGAIIHILIPHTNTLLAIVSAFMFIGLSLLPMAVISAKTRP